MENINLPVDNSSVNFSEARLQAVGKASEILSDPVIIAWKDDRAHRTAPEIPGGKGDRWHDYAENNGGKLELNVGDDFHFVFNEASDFEAPDLNVTSVIEGDGTTILCLNDACTEDDRKRMGYFPGGGIGG